MTQHISICSANTKCMRCLHTVRSSLLADDVTLGAIFSRSWFFCFRGTSTSPGSPQRTEWTWHVVLQEIDQNITHNIRITGTYPFFARWYQLVRKIKASTAQETKAWCAAGAKLSLKNVLSVINKVSTKQLVGICQRMPLQPSNPAVHLFSFHQSKR